MCVCSHVYMLFSRALICIDAAVYIIEQMFPECVYVWELQVNSGRSGPFDAPRFSAREQVVQALCSVTPPRRRVHPRITTSDVVRYHGSDWFFRSPHPNHRTVLPPSPVKSLTQNSRLLPWFPRCHTPSEVYGACPFCLGQNNMRNIFMTGSKLHLSYSLFLH